MHPTSQLERDALIYCYSSKCALERTTERVWKTIQEQAQIYKQLGYNELPYNDIISRIVSFAVENVVNEHWETTEMDSMSWFLGIHCKAFEICNGPNGYSYDRVFTDAFVKHFGSLSNSHRNTFNGEAVNKCTALLKHFSSQYSITPAEVSFDVDLDAFTIHVTEKGRKVESFIIRPNENGDIETITYSGISANLYLMRYYNERKFLWFNVTDCQHCQANDEYMFFLS